MEEVTPTELVAVSKRSYKLVSVAAVIVDAFLILGAFTASSVALELLLTTLLCLWSVAAGWLLLQLIPRHDMTDFCITLSDDGALPTLEAGFEREDE